MHKENIIFGAAFIFDVFEGSTEALSGRVGFFIVRFLGNSSFVFILSREGAFQTARVGLFGEGVY